MSGQTHYTEEVKKITKRILDYVHDPDDNNHPSKWNIKNPEGSLVCNGKNAYTLAYGFSKVYKKLTGNNNPKTYQTFGANWKYAKAIFKWSYVDYWSAFAFSPGEGWKTLGLVANSNCCQADNAGINWKAGIFDTPGFKYNANYHVPPFYEFVSGGLSYRSSNWFESLFDRAPCYGPYNNGNWGYQDWDWSATSITVHPERRGDLNPGFPGEYNGVDYLLLYMMYSRMFPWTNSLGPFPSSYYDYTKKVDLPYQFPGTSAIIGNDNNPLRILAYNNIYHGKIIYPNGNAKYRAGKDFIPLTGFDAQLGAELDIDVGEYECSTGDLYERTTLTPAIIIQEIDDNKKIDKKSLHATVFPVPFTTSINLEINNLEKGNFKIELIDAFGKVLVQSSENYGDNNSSVFRIIEVKDITSGHYIINIQNNNNFYSKRIIKVK